MAVTTTLMTGSLSFGSAAAQSSEPTLNLNPDSGPPGVLVAASGSGFAGACGVRLKWDGAGPELGVADVGPDGFYSTEISIPADATVGEHGIDAIELLIGRDDTCSLEGDDVAGATFVVTAPSPSPSPSPPPSPSPTPTPEPSSPPTPSPSPTPTVSPSPPSEAPSAKLKLPQSEAKPGEGFVLDAGDSFGPITAFNFDLDGNGSYETSCDGSKAAAVHNEPGTQQVGLQVVSADGQTSTDSATIAISGEPMAPPPDPDGGGNLDPFEEGTITGTCMEAGDVSDIAEATAKAWMCPQTVVVGTVEATFRKWGLNAADDDACFQRNEKKVAGFPITTFVATKPSPGPGTWRQNPVLVNGIEFAHPENNEQNWYANDFAINEKFKLIYSSGDKKFTDDYEWQLTVKSPGHETSFASEPFLWSDSWSIPYPSTLGHFTMGTDLYKPFAVNNEFLGLGVAKKHTPIAFTADHRAKMTVHVSPPFQNFPGASLPTAALEVVTENNGDHPLALPAGQSAQPYANGSPQNVALKFTGIKLGIFTMDANLTYQDEGGDDVWSGHMDLFFPGGFKVGGTLVIRNGEFEKAYADYDPGPPGIGPIGCCVWIYKIFGNLTDLWFDVGAIFGVGPTIPVINVRVAEVTGAAKIFYGEPWAFIVEASDLKLAGIPVNANAQAVLSSNGFLVFAFIDEDWGVLELTSNVEASVKSSKWYAVGGSNVCVDIEVLQGCGGGYAGIGKSGVAACAEVPWAPDGGVALDWDFFTGDLDEWSMWWGCAFGDVKGEVGANALSIARSQGPDGGTQATSSSSTLATVEVPSGLPKALFALKGVDAPPKVTLTDPNGSAIASAANEYSNSGPGWTLIEVPHDNTTYVSVEGPLAGSWKVEEQTGSTAISSIGFAEGLPQKVATGNVGGTGRTRTLHYEIADVDGLSVTFIERGGDPESSEPGEYVNHIIGTSQGTEGDIKFTPAESSLPERRIEAVIEVDGFPGETEVVTEFTAPELKPLQAPSLKARRDGGKLNISWTKVPGADFYRVFVDRSDGATEAFDVAAGTLTTDAGSITNLTAAVVRVQAVSPAGYFGKVAKATVKAVPTLRLSKKADIDDVLKGGGFDVRCVAMADGKCSVTIKKSKTVVARGGKTADYGDAVSFTAKLTGAGKRLLRRAKGKLRLQAQISVPGTSSSTRRIVLS